MKYTENANRVERKKLVFDFGDVFDFLFCTRIIERRQFLSRFRFAQNRRPSRVLLLITFRFVGYRWENTLVPFRNRVWTRERPSSSISKNKKTKNEKKPRRCYNTITHSCSENGSCPKQTKKRRGPPNVRRMIVEIRVNGTGCSSGVCIILAVGKPVKSTLSLSLSLSRKKRTAAGARVVTEFGR